MPADRIKATFTAEELQDINAALAKMDEIYSFRLNQSTEERVTTPLFDEASRTFMANSLALAEAHPELMPPSLDIAAFRKQVEQVERLGPIRQSLGDLGSKLAKAQEVMDIKALLAATTLYSNLVKNNLATDELHELFREIADDFMRYLAQKSQRGGNRA